MKHSNKFKYTLMIIIVFVFVVGLGMHNSNQLVKAKVKKTQISNMKQIEEKKVVKQNENKYKDKTWYAIGDSITSLDKYPYYLKDMMSLKKYVNDSIIGRKMGTMADRVTTTNLANIDFITVFGGTNDYAWNTPLGKINDGKTINSFYGNLQKVIDKIQSTDLNAELVFITPTKRGKFAKQPVYPNANSGGYHLEDYVQAIKDVCNKNNIKVIDLFNLSGIDETNLDTYTSDNLHPNEAGCKKIDEVIKIELEK